MTSIFFADSAVFFCYFVFFPVYPLKTDTRIVPAQIYRFQKGDADLALRFDLTVPLAKYVARALQRLSFPFRRYQIGKVYRGERAQRGRFREFYQADIDIIGDGRLSITNEAVDSRHLGFIPADHIVGNAWLCWYSPDKQRIFKPVH